MNEKSKVEENESVVEEFNNHISQALGDESSNWTEGIHYIQEEGGQLKIIFKE